MMITKQALFCLDENEYGLDIMDVSTVEKYIPIEKTTNVPKNVKGIINLRGDIIPVYSLRSKFGFEEKEPDQNTRLIITSSNGIIIAYEVDKMIGIVNVEPTQQYEVPSIVKCSNTSYMKQVTNLEGKLIVLMDHDGILSSDEQESLKKIIKK